MDDCKPQNEIDECLQMSIFDKKIFYSRRYADYNDIGLRDEETPPISVPPNFHMDSCEEFLKKINDKSRYVERPGGKENVKKFTRLAKYISETFEVDLDLAQRCGFVEADFFCYGIYLDDFTPEFATLLSLCDSMSVRPIRDRKDYVTISLTCHSHDHLLSDRKMTF